MTIRRNSTAALIFLGCSGLIVLWCITSKRDVSALKYAKQEVVLTDGGENAYQRSRLTGNGSAGLNDIKALGASSNHEATLPIHQKAESQSEEELYDVEAEQIKRKEHLEEACNRLGMSRTPPPVSWENTVHFIASDKFKLIFCFVPKISCTTWKEVMAKLYQADRDPLQKAPKIASRKWRFLKLNDIQNAEKVKQRWNTYAKVMFTREPLERVLSAYLDKFVYGNEHWDRQYGPTIVKRYRDQQISKVNFPLKEKIRFDEFIRFITDNGPNAQITQQTDHWLPASRITSPCQFKYDFIGHYETLNYDAPYVIKQFNLSRYVTFPEVHSSRSHEKLINAYNDVPRDLIYRLIDYYKTDYELFGYSANTTLDIIFNGRN
ncbi:carbohydrate sulfotransferase 14-like [Strongylocentrotus purpuratus]|uniref:Carbohydrate sulfotransferase n=1 Tax=Strongylocentrotus purpuratus TaxID=7668 RepID=A0A7M7SZ07_STRPU|nr:carbohydrate sulfotransferase 14-like [Strongylocentrotus purpuratus]